MISQILLSLFLLLQTTLAHVPYMDNGSHISYSTAFEFYDEIIARSFNINFDCPSVPVYTKVSVQNTTSFHVGFGLANITETIDYRPSIWVIGKSVIVPDAYADSTVNFENRGPYGINVPVGNNGFRVSSEANDITGIFGETEYVSFAILGAIQVNLTYVEDVFLIVEPQEQRRSRTWLAVGLEEVENPDEQGQSTDLVVDSWYVAETFPRIGQFCEAN